MVWSQNIYNAMKAEKEVNSHDKFAKLTVREFAIGLFNTTAHEIGHSLSLNHVSTEHVMYTELKDNLGLNVDDFKKRTFSQINSKRLRPR